jgi:glyoxalase family protein
VVHPILGLHHVTATVDDAQADLDFCLDGLGLRLVKKTVNFDNHDVYHFYYGTERGLPGTIWTTFPYGTKGVRVGAKGAGQVVTTSFSVPGASLGFWRARLLERGVEAHDVEPRFGEESIRIADPSGLVFELVASDRDGRSPWTGNGVGAPAAIRGLHSVTMVVRSPARTRADDGVARLPDCE